VWTLFLVDIPQRGTVATRYGDRGQLRHMVDHLHHSDVSVISQVPVTHYGADLIANGLQITWSSVPGKQYRIQWSDGLDSWTTLEDGGSPVTVPASAGTTTSHEVATGPPPSPSHRFYRVVLHVP